MWILLKFTHKDPNCITKITYLTLIPIQFKIRLQTDVRIILRLVYY